MEPFKLLKPGFGYFNIIQIKDTAQDGSPLLSQKGSPMLRLTLNVTDSEGETERVFDYLVANVEWKTQALSKCLKLNSPLYNPQRMGWDKELLFYASGFCSIKVEKGGNYGDRNSIATYLPEDAVKKLADQSVLEMRKQGFVMPKPEMTTAEWNTEKHQAHVQPLKATQLVPPPLSDDDIPF
jgi:hypothetical protein